MKDSLDYADINEVLCQHCAHCCLNTLIPITLDDRTYEYFITIGLDIVQDEDNPEVGILNVGKCKYLKKNGSKYKCSIYDDRPQLCADYNCVAWAKVAGVESEITKHAYNVYKHMKCKAKI